MSEIQEGFDRVERRGWRIRAFGRDNPIYHGTSGGKYFCYVYPNTFGFYYQGEKRGAILHNPMLSLFATARTVPELFTELITAIDACRGKDVYDDLIRSFVEASDALDALRKSRGRPDG